MNRLAHFIAFVALVAATIIITSLIYKFVATPIGPAAYEQAISVMEE